MGRPSMESDTYPYERVITGANRMDGAEEIPYKIIKYLLDLPDQHGYIPQDDNNRPRVRLAKYLWYEGANPLGNKLPSPEQKLSLVFDGDEPDINTDEQKRSHPKGYRIFPQVYWGPAELDAKVVLKCYIGRVFTPSLFLSKIGLVFEILVNSNLENTTRTDAYSRAWNIECAIVSALNGVNIAGVGTVRNDRPSHLDNGSGVLHDNGTHVGRILYMSLDWEESGTSCTVEDICS